MKSIITFTFASTLLAFASAFTTPVGTTPQGNPFSAPARAELVPKGTPYKITWNPTDKDHTVSLILLRGPSENCVPQYPIVEKAPNTGSYEWTPKSDLEVDTSRYGIQLIDDVTGFYQYTDQFGIKDGDGKNENQPTTLVTSTMRPTETDKPDERSTPEETPEDYDCGPENRNYLDYCV